MKKVLVLLVGLGLVISCDKEEALDDSSSTFKTTSIMALIESGNNDASRDVNRPGSVLDFINTIEITADHVETIGAAYKVSEVFTMVDDGTGASGFVLEDVALGRNKFEATAKSYNQTPAEEYIWQTDEADKPWEWIDAQRGRHPNVNFYDNNNALQDIYENPVAPQNVVNFDMQAESGRLIVGVKLSDEIRNTFYSNFVYVQHQVTYADNTKSNWSGMAEFNSAHIDDLLTFYFSDNKKSIDGACVEFRFVVCDSVSPGIQTNEFFRSICIENGKSIGCVYEITGDAVVENITNFNFTFNWEEVDCAPCPSNNYVTTVPNYFRVQQEMLNLCGTEVGSVHNIEDTLGLIEPGQYSVQLVMNGDATFSDVLMVKNGTNTDLGVSWTLNGISNGGFTIPKDTVSLVKLGDNTDVTNFVVGSTSGDDFTTGAITGCN
jgi:hypothetical protein